RVAALTGSRETALTALLARAVQRARAPVAKSEILAAEQLLIRVRFRGSRALYRQTLAAHDLTLDFARGIVADELAREKLSAAAGPVAAWTTTAEQPALDQAIC